MPVTMGVNPGCTCALTDGGGSPAEHRCTLLLLVGVPPPALAAKRRQRRRDPRRRHPVGGNPPVFDFRALVRHNLRAVSTADSRGMIETRSCFRAPENRPRVKYSARYLETCFSEIIRFSIAELSSYDHYGTRV